MKPESAKRIIDAFMEMFEELSLKTFKQGLAFVVESYEERLNKMKQIRSREGLEAMLLKEPEPDPHTLDKQVEAIRLLPYTIRKTVPEVMREFKRSLPHDPGGRDFLLENKDLKYVCLEIGKLTGMGVTLPDAQNRLAQQMSQRKGKNVSIRTIQRAWQQREDLFRDGQSKESKRSDR